MTGDADDLEAQADALLTAAGDEPSYVGDPEHNIADLVSGRARGTQRGFRACYVCVKLNGRGLTTHEEMILRLIGTALLEARAWIGSTNAWLTTEDGLFEGLEFRTLAPLAKERLSYVEVTASADKRRKKR